MFENYLEHSDYFHITFALNISNTNMIHFWVISNTVEHFIQKKVIDDFNDLFSRFSTHAWKNLVRLFLPFGSGSGGRGSGASVRVFFSGIARVISAHDRTRGHYYAKAVSKKKQHMLLYYDEDLEL